MCNGCLNDVLFFVFTILGHFFMDPDPDFSDPGLSNW